MLTTKKLIKRIDNPALPPELKALWERAKRDLQLIPRGNRNQAILTWIRENRGKQYHASTVSWTLSGYTLNRDVIDAVLALAENERQALAGVAA